MRLISVSIVIGFIALELPYVVQLTLMNYKTTILSMATAVDNQSITHQVVESLHSSSNRKTRNIFFD